MAEKHGVQNLEIRSIADCLNLPEYLDDSYPNDPSEVVRILKKHDQAIIALNSGFNLIGADEAARDELLAFARWAELLSVPLIRVFGGGSMERPLSDSELSEATANLQWWK